MSTGFFLLYWSPNDTIKIRRAQSLKMFTCWTFEQICQFKHLLQTSQLHFCACCSCLCVGAVLHFDEYRQFGAMSYCYLASAHCRRISMSRSLFDDCVSICSCSFFPHSLTSACVCVFGLPPQRHFITENYCSCLFVAYACMLSVWSVMRFLETKQLCCRLVPSLFIAHWR